MPELPEVETLRRELARVLPGKTIKTFRSPQFRLALAGRKITGVERRAKILIFNLDRGKNLLIHLKMTGQLVYEPHPNPPPRGGEKAIVGGHPDPPAGGLAKYTRAVFSFTDGSRLRFNDLRKFGWLKLANQSDLEKLHLAHGVEPLATNFTLARFNQILDRYPKRKLKQLLLDQTLIAGLGNIYVDEACFRAKVLPTRLVQTLTGEERAALRRAIIAVLRLAIKHNGSSARNYRRSDGTPGGFVPYLQVYGRGKEKCKKCGTPISKIKLNGRGTHFCPRCQQ